MMNDLSPSVARAWLESAAGETLPLSGNCSFGRSSGNTIVIRAESASRQHATIHAQDAGELWLIDLGSSNGTYLNDQRVSRPTRLQPGDRIRIAGHSWVFRQHAAAAAEWDESSAPTLLAAPPVREEMCWMLLADIEGFTPLSQELEAKALAELVGTWVKAGREVIENHGGTVNKYLGDGFLAHWCEGPGVAERVAQAVRDFQVLQAKRQPAFRVVVHRGLVIMGGGVSIGEEGFAGFEVNFIFRLEKLAGSLRVAAAASASAAEHLGAHLPTEPLPGEHTLKGVEGAHRLYAIR